ncbi:MAG: type I-E CRISPR-associated protein Cse2/CasB [Pseudoclavibacter sp.]|nr:type I-E CRISPR-associated protein Cse2/CasB [Pseudoclavibacter sp.]
MSTPTTPTTPEERPADRAAPPAKDPAERLLGTLLGLRERDDQAAIGQLAAVRRAIRPETERIAYPYLAATLEQLPPAQRIGVARVCGMVASFRRLGNAERPAPGTWRASRFGAVLGRAFPGGGSSALRPIGVRLATLPELDVETACEVVTGALERLDDDGPHRIDWFDLLRLLRFWDSPRTDRTQPAFDFYAHGDEPSERDETSKQN